MTPLTAAATTTTTTTTMRTTTTTTTTTTNWFLGFYDNLSLPYLGLALAFFTLTTDKHIRYIIIPSAAPPLAPPTDMACPDGSSPISASPSLP